MFEKKLECPKFKEIARKKIEENIFINELGCWVWKKSKQPFGYGIISIKLEKKSFIGSVHRVSWILYIGNIPEKMRVCHTCDNPSCCNPKHLFLGTAKDNTRDMIKKGRHLFDFVGEKNNTAILNDEIVLEMRKLRKKGMKVVEIAKRFQLKYYTCLDAVSGRNWKHI